MNAEKGIFKLETKCVNQAGECVIDGEAVVKYTENGKPEQEKEQAGTFYSEEELKKLGLKKYGQDVRISRNAVLYHPELLEIGNHVRIDDFTTISGRVELGDYVHIAQFCGLYGGEAGIFMDDFSGLSSRVVIYATSNDYSGESLTNPTVPMKYKAADKNAAVHLCRHVIIGTTSVILPGVTIGEGSSVGALSMCGKDLAPWGVYAGSPARRIKERSMKLLELEKELRAEEKSGEMI
ncbi:MAG: acyltransferase [Lachnospiraceae bacterium]|nr:acyltransferase [Lachnospiraceae bacterium]